MAKASEHPVVRRYARHVNPALVNLLGVLGYGRLFVGAEGAHMTDHEGRRYLDALAGFGSMNAGHSHPEIVAAMVRVIEQGEAAPGEGARALAAELTAASGLASVVFLTSGSEAIDRAMRLVRAATGRRRLIHAGLSYHGLNLGALSLAGAPRMREPFAPLLDGCRQVPYGDVDALRAIDDETAALFVEPVQIEGGMALPPAGYLAAARERCREVGALLVIDEIQAGLGRTGRLFASEIEGVQPDVLVLGKALGGGVTALSAVLASGEVAARAGGLAGEGLPEGHAVSCAAGLAHLAVLRREGLADNARAQGERLIEGLRARLAGHPLVRGIRGRGLLVGVELGGADSVALRRLSPALMEAFAEGVVGHWVAVRMLERGVICQPTTHRPDVLRLEPPLTIRASEIDEIIAALCEVLAPYRSLPPLMADIARRLGMQALRGWSF
jgi:putrescine aminotransferase